MSTTDGYLPIVPCPACKQEFQMDDYYDVRVGSTRVCPHCEETIEVLRADTMVYCQFGIKAS
jgi:uncharacterized protein YbaR (Trm112 family)